MNNDITDNSNLLNNGQADTDLKSNSNLLNNADSTKEVLTEVTSIAAEEARTGQTIDVGTPEDIYAKAMSSYVRNMHQLDEILSAKAGNKAAISRNGMDRVLMAILQLPQDGLPVRLKTDLETAAFGIGQRIIADRYLMTHYHIVEEAKKRKALQAEQVTAQQTNNEGENNEQQQ